MVNNDPKKSEKGKTLKFKRVDLLADDDGDNLQEFVSNLNAVDTNKPDAKLNETTINDNNGGRIILNEDDDKIVKK